MMMNHISHFLLVFMIVCFITSGVRSNFCEKRSLSEIEEGQKCMKTCTTDADCKGKRRKCICDGVCGMSCINQESTCNRLPSLPKGRTVYSDPSRKYLSIARQLCDRGYVLSGESIRRCRSDGKYSGESAKCVELTNWGSWSECSKTCGSGIRSRANICLSKYCTDRNQTEECNNEECPEPWSDEWTAWGDCNVQCGVGIQNRTKECILENGCSEDPPTQRRQCEMPACEEVTTTQSPEEEDTTGSGMQQVGCSAPGELWNGLVLGTNENNEYGRGHLLRYACSYGYKLMGNYTNECMEVTSEDGSTQYAWQSTPWCARRYNVPLPSPPTWSEWDTEWSQWSPCSVSCGTGIQHRSRSCSDGKTCMGPAGEDKKCSMNDPHSVHCPSFVDDGDICNDGFCNNHGTCIFGPDGNFCECKLPYAGEHCENNTDQCNSSPCWNGGECVNLPDENSFMCKCPPGYKGDQCEEEITCWVPYYLNNYGIDVLLTPSGEIPTETRVKYGQTIIYACNDVSKSVYGYQCAVCGDDGMLRRPYSTLYVRVAPQTQLPVYKICANIIAVPVIS